MFEENHRYSCVLLGANSPISPLTFESLRKVLSADIEKAKTIAKARDFKVFQSSFFSPNICHNPEFISEENFSAIHRDGNKVFVYNLYAIEFSEVMDSTADERIEGSSRKNFLMIMAPYVGVLRAIFGASTKEGSDRNFKFVRPLLDELLTYLREKGSTVKAIRLNLETGYEQESQRITIAGRDPVGSVIYQHIEDMTSPVSVKLALTEPDEASVRLTADRYGNYFFHLHSVSHLPKLHPILSFLSSGEISEPTTQNPLRRAKIAEQD